MYSKDYQDLVEKIHGLCENDTERLIHAKRIMTHDQYVKYELETLQRKAFIVAAPGVGTNDKPKITFNLEDIDDFLRAVLQLEHYVESKAPYGYVEKKSENFIKTLKKNLY